MKKLNISTVCQTAANAKQSLSKARDTVCHVQFFHSFSKQNIFKKNLAIKGDKVHCPFLK